jgi:predicted TIM-barrel fold metal-dependent hydrolase
VSQRIDIHAHFAPPSTAARRDAQWAAMRKGHFMLPEPFEWSLAATLEYLDESGTDMQMLSNVPRDHHELRACNDFAAEIVRQYPNRFGLLAALPTDDPKAALSEIERASVAHDADGFAVTTTHNGVWLGDRSLAPVWDALDELEAVVFVHPDPYSPPMFGQPTPLYEVAFDSARTVFGLLYTRTLQDHPRITFVIAHCGGAFPALAGRVGLLGAEPWVPNPERLTRAEIVEDLGRLWVDTAATATDHSLAPAIETVGAHHIVYGSDWGAPCTTTRTALANAENLRGSRLLTADQCDRIDRGALSLFPRAAARLARSAGDHGVEVHRLDDGQVRDEQRR